MTEVYLAQWSDDTHPQFGAETLERLIEEIDEWYGYPKDKEVLKGKFKRDMSEYEGVVFGSIEYTTEGVKDIVKILNYYLV